MRIDFAGGGCVGMTRPSGNRCQICSCCNKRCCVSVFFAYHVHDYFESRGLLSGNQYSSVEMIDFTSQKLYNKQKKHFLGYKGLRRAVFEIMKAVFLVDDAGSGGRISCEKNNNTFEWRDWQKQTAFGVMLCDDALWSKTDAQSRGAGLRGRAG